MILSSGYNISPNKASIINLTQILVNCSVVRQSYINSQQSQVLYAFAPNYQPYAMIAEKPIQIMYLPINCNVVTSIRIWLTDQDGNAIKLNNENVSVWLEFKCS